MTVQTVMSADHALKSSPSSGLSRAALLRMADAGVEVVDCIRRLHECQSNLVNEALRGYGDFTEWEHYPPNDVHDPKSHAQYYFHAHAPDDRDAPEYGHFHTFMRPKGMPAGIRPAAAKHFVPPADDNRALSHLIAISMTPAGLPERLFTTNRWVTGETWYRAADVIAMLDRFAIDVDRVSPLLNRWLTAMFALFRPQIECLLHERDRAVEQWCTNRLGTNVHEDRSLEITSSMEISLHKHIEWLDAQLDTNAEVRCSASS